MNMVAFNSNIGFLKMKEDFNLSAKNSNQKDSFENYINTIKDKKHDSEALNKTSSKMKEKKCFVENERPVAKKRKHVVEETQPKEEKIEQGNVDTNLENDKISVDEVLVENKTKKYEKLIENAEKLDSETMKKLSSILEIPEEITMGLLSELNLTPTDLTNSENLNKFVQIVYQVKETDEFQNIYGSISVEPMDEQFAKQTTSTKPMGEQFSKQKTTPNIIETFKNVENMLRDAEKVENEVSKIMQNLENIDGFENPNNIELVNVESGDLKKFINDNIANLHQQTEMKISENMENVTIIESKQATNEPDFNIFDALTSTSEGEPTQEVEVTYNPKNEGLVLNSGNNEMGQNGNEENDNIFLQNEFQITENPSDLIVSAENIFSKSIQHAQSNISNIAASNINTADVVNQIIENMKVEIKGNTHEVKMTLYPEQLGDVSLKITSDNGVITAAFVTENQKVKEIIEANFSQLRENFKEQGLELSKLSVFVNQNNDRQDRQYTSERENALNRMNKIRTEIQNIGEIEQIETNSQISRELVSSNIDFKA